MSVSVSGDLRSSDMRKDPERDIYNQGCRGVGTRGHTVPPFFPGRKLVPRCFYRAMLRRALGCHGKSSVRPSGCPPVCDVEIL